MDFQLLKNVPVYKRSYWAFPTIGIDRQCNSHSNWIAILLIFGKTAIGFRVYFKTLGE
jgi:hypothetical protein